MRRLRILSVIGLQLLFISVSGSSLAVECPTINTPDPLYTDDKNCLAVLESKFKEYSPDIPFQNDRNSLLSDFAFANQQFIVDTFYVKYCHLLKDEKFAFSAQQQDEKLLIAKEKLYHRVPFADVIVDTRNISYLAPEISLFADLSDKNNVPQFLNVTAGVPLNVDDNTPSGPASDANDFLQKPPYLITRANKYFVIVSSVKTYDGALKEVTRLKKKAPQFDFVAYAPYGRNQYHGIMMATWVSKETANLALSEARKFVNEGSYPWHCPSEGEFC